MAVHIPREIPNTGAMFDEKKFFWIRDWCGSNTSGIKRIWKINFFKETKIDDTWHSSLKMHIYYWWRIMKQSPGWYHAKNNKSRLPYIMKIEERRRQKYCFKFFICYWRWKIQLQVHVFWPGVEIRSSRLGANGT